MKPLAIDLYCGLGGWTEGLLSEGYEVVGFDIERHVYGAQKYPAQLVIQDVTTLHGSQFKGAALIVASPPCQAYSSRGMPWNALTDSLTPSMCSWADDGGAVNGWLPCAPIDNTLFRVCFQIQREACEAAGRHVPLIVENVNRAQKWVGVARWHFGSYYLWGDVPVLMPFEARSEAVKVPSGEGRRTDVGKGARFTSRDCGLEGVKQHGSGAAWFDKALDERRKEATGVKNGGAGTWFHGGSVIGGSISVRASERSDSRKAASAQIAKIPFELSRFIAATFKPS